MEKKAVGPKALLMAGLIGILLLSGCNALEYYVVPANTELPDSNITVPIALENRVPFVEATINGQGPYTLLVDTGNSGVLALSDSTARELNLPSTRIKATRIMPNGDKVPALRTVRVSELKLGKAVFQDFLAEVNTLGGFPHLSFKCDGILGFGMFKDCLLTIDFPRQELRLERGELARSDDLHIIPAEIVDGSPRIPVLVGLGTPKPVKLKLMVDTGFNGCMVLPKKAKAYPFPWKPMDELTVASTHGLDSAVVGVLQADVVIGHRIIANPTVRYLKRDGLIGTRLLQFYAVTFDQKNRLVRLDFNQEEALSKGVVHDSGAR